MKHTFILLFGFFAILVLFRCKKAPEYPVEPQITLVSALPGVLKPDADSLKIKFSFTDGDGDLGYNDNENTSHDTTIFVKDIRPNSIGNPYTYIFDMPRILAKGSFKQITGTFTINMFGSTSCRPDFPSPRNFDTVKYEIKIRDRAGHTSNVISTPDIIFQCK